MRRLVLCAAIAAIAAPATAKVRPAADNPEALETTVRLSDVDLERAPGADVALRRILVASARVCGEAPVPRQLTQRARYRACVAHAAGTAVTRLDAPLVTALYRGGDTATLAMR